MSSYPSGYDSFSSPGTNLSSTPLHSDMHDDMIDAMEAVQAELGLSPSGSDATVAARLDRLDRPGDVNANNLTSGTVPSARMSGSYTGITGVGTLGSLSVSGTVTAGTFSGSGASLTSLNASNLGSGTVPSARISGAYTGITQVGTLTGLTVSSTINGSITGNAAYATSAGSATTATNATNASNFTGSSISMSGGLTCATVTANGIGIGYPGATAGGGSANWIGFRWDGANIVGVVDNAVALALANVSDERLKTDVRDLPGWAALLHVKHLRPVEYTPVDLDGTVLDRRMHGLIAQDVRPVLPDLVFAAEGTQHEYLSIDYARLTAVLVAALQDVDRRVESLEWWQTHVTERG